MASFYIGEVRSFPYGTVPNGWLPCDGQLLTISQNQALFGLLGIRYGGDGQSTFALPNLRGDFVIGSGAGYNPGDKGGEVTHTLQLAEMPSHTHDAIAATETDASKLQVSPQLAYPAVPGTAVYATTANTTLSGGSKMTGGDPHPNMPPYVAVSFCIATEGVFPPRT